MKLTPSVMIATLALFVPAISGAQPADTPPELRGSPWATPPMRAMMEEGSMSHGPMMNPRMREMMMRQRQKMAGDGLNPDMHRRHHQMMQRMMERRMDRMQGQGSPGGGMMGMRHSMMHEMRAQKMEHMKAMEERLQRIEALLEELVEKPDEGAE